MDKIKTIWSVPKYLPYVQPELTDEMVQKTEEIIGYKIPKEYVEILKIQNGGYIRFALENLVHSQIFGIGPYFPSLQDVDWNDHEEYTDIRLNGLVPFDGDGHWYLCLDYRINKNAPTITYIDIECNSEQILYKNFKEYLNSLKIETENMHVIETNETIKDMVLMIGKILNIEFEEPDFFSHGYAIYSGKYNKNWIWISPNKVPLGFIREEDRRFEELKSQMEGSGLRYPELPEQCIIIESEREIENEIIEILIENKIKTNELKNYI
jgi:hypothetical protein